MKEETDPDSFWRDFSARLDPAVSVHIKFTGY